MYHKDTQSLMSSNSSDGSTYKSTSRMGHILALLIETGALYIVIMVRHRVFLFAMS